MKHSNFDACSYTWAHETTLLHDNITQLPGLARLSIIRSENIHYNGIEAQSVEGVTCGCTKDRIFGFTMQKRTDPE